MILSDGKTFNTQKNDSRYSLSRFGFFDEIRYRFLLAKGFLLAAFRRNQKSLSGVKLPAVSASDSPFRSGADSALIMRAINSADSLTDALVHFTTRKCFFRAFTAGYILRKKGIDVCLNVGLHHLTKKDRKVRGHCWLSWQGQPVGEHDNPHVRYATYLGEGQNGVCFWLGGEDTAKHKIVHYRTRAKGHKANAAFENQNQ